jgi:2-hydroxycyclohexanecarboxyl-CoA dehydrogenase
MPPIRTDLAGKVALITGGGRGIGASVAEALATCGAAVAVCDIDGAAAATVVEELARQTRARTLPVQVDVGSRQSVRAAVREVETELGAVDILVTVAGLNLAERFVESDCAGWQRVIDVNLFGTLHPCREVLPGMVERARGRVITFGSDAGKVGSAGNAVYAATKGGVIAFTKTLAREVAAKGVTVNCVCPGPTDTPMTQQLGEDNPKLFDALARAIPMGRLGRPEELAAAVAFLAGDGAAFITGQAISVSGGLTMN